nr:MAG TPA: chitin synthase regulator [Caudoviricetes sp.]
MLLSLFFCPFPIIFLVLSLCHDNRSIRKG